MRKKMFLFFTATCMLLMGCQCEQSTVNEYDVVPLPNQLTPKEGRFNLSNRVTVNITDSNHEVEIIAQEMIRTIKEASGISLTPGDKNQAQTNSISFISVPDMGKEDYYLSVTPEQIIVKASAPNGFFYAVQTIYQLLPPEIYGTRVTKRANWSIPCVEIEDSPRFSYRGWMLDPVRHFAPLEYVYKYIDLMAMHKINTFHLHLTDDQGWRIEIKKYPKLTEVGSKRSETLVDYYFTNYPHIYDGKEHTGYYTQEELKELVAYAANKYITIIPEIEMPGHALAALASYPELSCNPDTVYEVSKKWGIFEEVFCVKEETFELLTGVLDEVIEIFPSSYIHIGGDECPKTAWINCPHCKSMIKKLGLKDDVNPNPIDGKKHTKEEKLQSYFVHRIEQYLNSKGRNIIGWDEILEGGLAPNATVMSWRGVRGGMNAAKAGHNAIMAPTDYCYLDYYQEDPEVAPMTIGNYNTLKKTYSYNPIPDDADELIKKHIIGVQANTWAEYMYTLDKRDYQIFPRAIALAETGWTENSRKDWKDFCKRMPTVFDRLDLLEVNACRNFFDVNLNTHVEPEGLKIYLETFYPEATIYYTIDGSSPSINSLVYTGPFLLEGKVHLKAVAFVNGKRIGKISEKILYGNLISGKPYEVVPKSSYFRGDVIGKDDHLGTDTVTMALTNGKRGFTQDYLPWVGFYLNTGNNHEVTFTVKLDEPTPISRVVFGSLNNPAMSIRAAGGAMVEISEDGKEYRVVTEKTFANELTGKGREMITHTLEFDPIEATFVRLKIKGGGDIVNGVDSRKSKRAPVYPADVFIDEIEIY